LENGLSAGFRRCKILVGSLRVGSLERRRSLVEERGTAPILAGPCPKPTSAQYGCAGGRNRDFDDLGILYLPKFQYDSLLRNPAADRGTCPGHLPDFGLYSRYERQILCINRYPGLDAAR
jgi:hypothetical protein